MYSGRLIEQLIESVERAEEQSMAAQLAITHSFEDPEGHTLFIYEWARTTQPSFAGVA
jgi:hypothetical protein